MHIVDVCAFYAPQGGGVKTYVEQKLAAMPRDGHRMTLVVPGEVAATHAVGSNAQIIAIPSPKLPLDRRYRYFADEPALHALLDALQPDVVEASSPWASASMVARWRGSAVRSLVMHADPLAAYAYRWLDPVLPRGWIDRSCAPWWNHLRTLDAQFDIVVSANASLSQRLADGGMRRVITIPMGITPGVFSPALRSETVRRAMLAQCGLGQDATLLLAVGRLAAEKRLPMVIDAVRAAGMAHPLGLAIIGDGPLRSRVGKAIAGNPHVVLLAPTRDRGRLATLMASADALVHGCEAETFGMVAAEARASGLPLIVPDTGGAADQVSGGAGLCYRAGDGDSLSQAIHAFVGVGPAAMRHGAARVASQTATLDTHFAALSRHYAAIRAGYARAA